MCIPHDFLAGSSRRTCMCHVIEVTKDSDYIHCKEILVSFVGLVEASSTLPDERKMRILMC